MKKLVYYLMLIVVLPTVVSAQQIVKNDYTITPGTPVPRHVIESYLSRSIHLQTGINPNLIQTPQAPAGSPTAPHSFATFDGSDHITRIKDIITQTKPKYLNLADGSWWFDRFYTDDQYWDQIEWLADIAHTIDDEIMMEAGLFEQIDTWDHIWPFVLGDDPDELYLFNEWSQDPDWPIDPATGLPANSITITADNMTYDELIWARNHNSVPGNTAFKTHLFPDMSKLTTRVYWYWRITQYILRGYESFHMGVMNNMLVRDCNNEKIADLLNRIKFFGSLPNSNNPSGVNAYRGHVFFNAQTMVQDVDYCTPSGCLNPTAVGTNCSHLPETFWTNSYKHFNKQQVYYYGDPDLKNILWDWGSAPISMLESNPPPIDPSTGTWPQTFPATINDIANVWLARSDNQQFKNEDHGFEPPYGHSIGGNHPQGWKCDHMPYIAVWDNTNGGATPIEYSRYNWTYNMDDKTWFLSLPNQFDRVNFITYGYSMVKCLDKNAHFVMPGSWRDRPVLDPTYFPYSPNSAPQNYEPFPFYQQTTPSFNLSSFWYASDAASNLTSTIKNIWDNAEYHADRSERFSAVNKRDGSVHPTFSWGEKIYTGDFNSDGKDDVLATADNDPGVGISWDGYQVYQATPSGDDFEATGFLGQPFQVPHPCNAPGQNYIYLSWGEKFHVGDFDGDGFKNDIAVTANGQLGITCPAGVRFYKSQYWTGPNGEHIFAGFVYTGTFLATPNWDERIYIGDFNGDGKDDILATPDNRPPVNNQAHGNFHVYYNTSSGGNISFSSPSVFWNCNTGCTAWGEEFHIGDFDGDGKDDFFVVADPTTGITWQGLELYSSTGTNFTYQGNLTCSGGGCFPSWGENFHVGDFDNDGKDDFIVNADMQQGINWQGYRVFMNKTGVNYVNFTFDDKGQEGNNGNQCLFPSWGERFNTGDFNGDGNSDFIVTADKTLGIDWDGWDMYWSKGQTYGSWKPGKDSSATSVSVEKLENRNIVKADGGVLVYPNPANNIVTFKSLTEKQLGSIVITSIDGRRVRVRNNDAGKKMVDIDISDLQSGVYIYTINLGVEKTNGRFTKL